MPNEARKRSLLEAGTEVVISVLPLIVVLLVMSHVGKPLKLFAKPEWAFGAAIFFGQALVKLLAAMSAPHRTVQAGKVILFAACILVFGLAPTLLILVFVILGAEQSGQVPMVFQVLQVLLFTLSAFAYVVVAAATHELSPAQHTGDNDARAAPKARAG